MIHSHLDVAIWMSRNLVDHVVRAWFAQGSNNRKTEGKRMREPMMSLPQPKEGVMSRINHYVIDVSCIIFFISLLGTEVSKR